MTDLHARNANDVLQLLEIGATGKSPIVLDYDEAGLVIAEVDRLRGALEAIAKWTPDYQHKPEQIARYTLDGFTIVEDIG